ncbi:glutamate racemase [Chitinophaga caeni]|uniref:Glutamate racemase n=1 Tax=Chitinophaga caeni TaxID=2029983 RepID=A0A291QYL8_9BACT|nr:glutamate racemase [Chitinophaga caeni]ATL49038.1 glutamate racemase [Chitinophaga caeni]
MKVPGPIGVFDSGYGGLTVLKEFVKRLPTYDYLYLGDNARAPYGTRSFDTVYNYTLECVRHLFDRGCALVILACNTASAKALRSIQQNDLPKMDATKRVLGVIRPTTEIVGRYTKSGHIGILGTMGTVNSGSYPIEIKKFSPGVSVAQHACPMWVPLVENNEWNQPGADYFVEKDIHKLLATDPLIDTIVLGCTHYPLLMEKIRQYVPRDTQILSQGPIVAASLEDYLQRHKEIAVYCSENGTRQFLTTDDPVTFDRHAAIFFEDGVQSEHLAL